MHCSFRPVTYQSSHPYCRDLITHFALLICDCILLLWLLRVFRFGERDDAVLAVVGAVTSAANLVELSGSNAPARLAHGDPIDSPRTPPPYLPQPRTARRALHLVLLDKLAAIVRLVIIFILGIGTSCIRTNSHAAQTRRTKRPALPAVSRLLDVLVDSMRPIFLVQFATAPDVCEAQDV